MDPNRRAVLGGFGVLGTAALSTAPVVSARPGPSIRRRSLDVVDFGALGDGTADDTQALQDAIDAAVSGGGGRVHIPAGRYRLTTRITLGDGVDLAGVGSASVLEPDFHAPINRVIDNDWAAGNRNISLRNFKLDRSGSNVAHGILVNGVDNLLIDGVEVSGIPPMSSGCISVSGVGPKKRLVSRNVRIVNCVLSDTSNFGMHFGYVDGGVMASNTASNADREVFGVEPDPGTWSTNVVITGNSIVGTPKISGTATGLIIVTTTSGGSVSGVTIAGNVMRQPSVSNTSNPGITVLGATAVSVTGNTIYDMDGAGIFVGNADVLTTGVVVTGNMIFNCGRTDGAAGIRLRNARSCSVTANHIFSSDGSPSIVEEAGSKENQISGNFPNDFTPSAPTPPVAAPNIFPSLEPAPATDRPR